MNVAQASVLKFQATNKLIKPQSRKKATKDKLAWRQTVCGALKHLSHQPLRQVAPAYVIAYQERKGEKSRIRRWVST